MCKTNIESKVGNLDLVCINDWFRFQKSRQIVLGQSMGRYIKILIIYYFDNTFLFYYTYKLPSVYYCYQLLTLRLNNYLYMIPQNYTDTTSLLTNLNAYKL